MCPRVGVSMCVLVRVCLVQCVRVCVSVPVFARAFVCTCVLCVHVRKCVRIAQGKKPARSPE